MLENVYEGLNAQKCKGCSNQKIKKTKSIYFLILLLGGPSPTHSTGPQKLFFTEISVSVAQIKKIKKQGAFFFKFCFWEDPPHPVNWCPTHSIGPLICFLLNFRACLYWFPICLSLLLTFLSFLGQVCNCDFKMLTGNAKWKIWKHAIGNVVLVRFPNSQVCHSNFGEPDQWMFRSSWEIVLLLRTAAAAAAWHKP